MVSMEPNSNDVLFHAFRKQHGNLSSKELAILETRLVPSSVSSLKSDGSTATESNSSSTDGFGDSSKGNLAPDSGSWKKALRVLERRQMEKGNAIELQSRVSLPSHASSNVMQSSKRTQGDEITEKSGAVTATTKALSSKAGESATSGVSTQVPASAEFNPEIDLFHLMEILGISTSSSGTINDSEEQNTSKLLLTKNYARQTSSIAGGSFDMIDFNDVKAKGSEATAADDVSATYSTQRKLLISTAQDLKDKFKSYVELEINASGAEVTPQASPTQATGSEDSTKEGNPAGKTEENAKNEESVPESTAPEKDILTCGGAASVGSALSSTKKGKKGTKQKKVSRSFKQSKQRLLDHIAFLKSNTGREKKTRPIEIGTEEDLLHSHKPPTGTGGLKRILPNSIFPKKSMASHGSSKHVQQCVGTSEAIATPHHTHLDKCKAIQKDQIPVDCSSVAPETTDTNQAHTTSSHEATSLNRSKSEKRSKEPLAFEVTDLPEGVQESKTSASVLSGPDADKIETLHLEVKEQLVQLLNLKPSILTKTSTGDKTPATKNASSDQDGLRSEIRTEEAMEGDVTDVTASKGTSKKGSISPQQAHDAVTGKDATRGSDSGSEVLEQFEQNKPKPKQDPVKKSDQVGRFQNVVDSSKDTAANVPNQPASKNKKPAMIGTAVTPDPRRQYVRSLSDPGSPGSSRKTSPRRSSRKTSPRRKKRMDPVMGPPAISHINDIEGKQGTANDQDKTEKEGADQGQDGKGRQSGSKSPPNQTNLMPTILTNPCGSPNNESSNLKLGATSEVKPFLSNQTTLMPTILTSPCGPPNKETSKQALGATSEAKARLSNYREGVTVTPFLGLPQLFSAFFYPEAYGNNLPALNCEKRPLMPTLKCAESNGSSIIEVGDHTAKTNRHGEDEGRLLMPSLDDDVTLTPNGTDLSEEAIEGKMNKFFDAWRFDCNGRFEDDLLEMESDVCSMTSSSIESLTQDSLHDKVSGTEIFVENDLGSKNNVSTSTSEGNTFSEAQTSPDTTPKKKDKGKDTDKCQDKGKPKPKAQDKGKPKPKAQDKSKPKPNAQDKGNGKGNGQGKEKKRKGKLKIMVLNLRKRWKCSKNKMEEGTRANAAKKDGNA